MNLLNVGGRRVVKCDDSGLGYERLGKKVEMKLFKEIESFQWMNVLMNGLAITVTCQ